jgi:hypothetical protein
MVAYWPNSSEVFAAPMNEIPNEPCQNEQSICIKRMAEAEREFSAFFKAVTELFGPEQGTLAAKDWLQSLETMTDLPGSPRDWRLVSIEALVRLAKRVICGNQMNR